MIRIAICDDEKETILENEEKIRSYLRELNQYGEVFSYQSSDFLKYDIEEHKFFDLLLIDIEMPGTSGLDIAQMVKKVSPETLVIFITSHNEYAMDAYELSVFRYISKDNINKKLFSAVKDAIDYIEIQKDKEYIIATPTQYEKIPYEKIFYLKKEDKNTIFNTATGEKSIRKSINKVYAELDETQFVYIDRGCIVNIVHIMRLDDKDVIMRNGVVLPASKKKMQELRKILNNFWGERI